MEFTRREVVKLLGLQAAYAKSFQVDMPRDSIAIKGDWIPLPTLLQWVPGLVDINNIRKLYYTVTLKNVEYALVAMHVGPFWKSGYDNWLHFAGEHTCYAFVGYMEGALCSGYRLARQLAIRDQLFLG
jgi:hypothetical protein